MRVLLDENLPPLLEARGRDRGYDMRSATPKGAAASLCGQPDEDVIAYALANGMVLMTANCQDFVTLYRAAGNGHPGVVLIKQEYPPRQSLTRQGLIDAFDTICDDLDARPTDALTGKALYYKWLGGRHHLRLDEPPYAAHAGW